MGSWTSSLQNEPYHPAPLQFCGERGEKKKKKQLQNGQLTTVSDNKWHTGEVVAEQLRLWATDRIIESSNSTVGTMSKTVNLQLLSCIPSQLSVTLDLQMQTTEYFNGVHRKKKSLHSRGFILYSNYYATDSYFCHDNKQDFVQVTVVIWQRQTPEDLVVFGQAFRTTGCSCFDL